MFLQILYSFEQRNILAVKGLTYQVSGAEYSHFQPGPVLSACIPANQENTALVHGWTENLL